MVKYRLEDEQIADFVSHLKSLSYPEFTQWCQTPLCKNPLSEAAFAQLKASPDQDIAIWYNDSSTSLTTGAVIYPDKVRLNCYYYRHYSFLKDIEMIFATVLGWKIKFAGEEF